MNIRSACKWIIAIKKWLMKKIILLLFVSGSLLGGAQQIAPDKLSDTTVKFTVYGKCAMCKERIEKAAKGKGVHSANWDIQSKILTLQYNSGHNIGRKDTATNSRCRT